MSEIFGAQAKIFMRYGGSIEGLSKELSKGLILPDFSVGPREYPPYDITGSCEALGFEIWLNTVKPDEGDFVDGYNFELEISTGMSHDEIMNDRMYNLSLWLGRYVAVMCNVDTCILDAEDGQVFFKAGNN